MKGAIATGVGALLLAIALLITAPATLLDARVAALSSGRVRIAAAQGTLWNGSGELLLLPDGTRRPLAWHLDAWPLLRGEIQGTLVKEPGAQQPAEFAYSFRRIELRRFDLSLPMESILRSAGVPAALAAASGNVAAHVEQLAQTPDAIDAKLSLQWRDASLPGPRPGVRIALGDVKLDLDGRGPEVGGSLTNRGGDVEIAGRVAASATGAPRLEATVRPRAGIDRDRAEAVATALSLLGPGDGQGGYRIAWPRS